MVGHESTQESACEQIGHGRDSQVRWSSVFVRDKAALDVPRATSEDSRHCQMIVQSDSENSRAGDDARGS